VSYGDKDLFFLYEISEPFFLISIYKADDFFESFDASKSFERLVFEYLIKRYVQRIIGSL